MSAGYWGDDIEIADGAMVQVGTSDNTIRVRHPIFLLTDNGADAEYFWLDVSQARALAAQLIAAADHAEGR